MVYNNFKYIIYDVFEKDKRIISQFNIHHKCCKGEKIMNKKEKIFYGIAGVIVMLILIASVSYAYIRYTTKQARIDVVGTDCIQITLKDISNAINVEHAYPLTEEQGKKTKP